MKVIVVHDRRGYAAGCRCAQCREGHRISRAELVAARRERLLADPTVRPHGVANTYTNWGCRCEPCRAACRAREAAPDRRRDRFNPFSPRMEIPGSRQGRGQRAEPFGREWTEQQP